jgi:nucleotide-binding universal stress UspA family protein
MSHTYEITEGAGSAGRGKLLMVAADDSEQSNWAAQVAASLAQALGAHVVVVHVMDFNAFGASEVAFGEGGLRAELRRKADEVFAAALLQFPQGVVVQRLLREGDPGKEIVASAAEWEADFVVMGTHGRGRLANFLVGSTAEAVIRGAHCPVLTVAHDPHGPAPGAGGSVTLASVAL